MFEIFHDISYFVGILTSNALKYFLNAKISLKCYRFNVIKYVELSISFMTLRISYFKLMLQNRVIFSYREQRKKPDGTENTEQKVLLWLLTAVFWLDA